MKSELTIIIPNRPGENPNKTIETIDYDCDLVVIYDKWNNANKCRNEGFKQCNTEFVLFCDNDIFWRPRAIERLLNKLKENVSISYSYGYYILTKGEEKRTIGREYFSLPVLLKRNYISTMSVIRSAHFPGFDENIKRFQDWDLWLTMASCGQFGEFAEVEAFTTEQKKGITDWTNREETIKRINIIKKKHHDLYSDSWV